MVKISHAEFMEEAERQIRSLLRQRHRTAPDDADDFTVRNLAEVQAQEKEASDVFTRLLVAVAFVSLVVGGISIMNIMLVSVTERTREIGLRLAVGARPVDVRNQFLIEAVTLTLLGGAVGTVLGMVVSVVVARIAGWPILIQVDAIAISVVFAAGIGLFFGFYPAYRASLLDPSVALRSE